MPYQGLRLLRFITTPSFESSACQSRLPHQHRVLHAQRPVVLGIGPVVLDATSHRLGLMMSHEGQTMKYSAGWLTMLPETKDTLETSGFMLPGEDAKQMEPMLPAVPIL